MRIMETKTFLIGNIPSILWGPLSDKLLIAVHGNGSHKTDVVIEIVATAAVEKGYQLLSFELPEHGGRKEERRNTCERNKN